MDNRILNFPVLTCTFSWHSTKSILAKDEALFTFATDPEWKEKLHPKMMERMTSLITDYEEALRSCRYLRIDAEYMSRKSDINKFLFSPFS